MQFQENDIILYPTDTLYGLGVDATNPEMVKKLKELKGRDDGKPISIAVSDIEMLRAYAEVTPLAERLIEQFLPGKLTLILNVKDSSISHLSTDGSVGVRIPFHEGTLKLIQEFGKPITATSANVSNMPTESTPEAILKQFGKRSPEPACAGRITQVIDEGELPDSTPSTVVDARGAVPIIVREGAISAQNIKDVVSL